MLAYWGGLTADEIARRSGVPLGTAKSRVRLGLQRMRAELERGRDELDLEPGGGRRGRERRRRPARGTAATII